MKIVQINATCGIGSTGKICVDISKLLNEQNVENYVLYSGRTNGYENGISFSDVGYIKRQAVKSRLTGNYGFQSKKATRKLIQILEEIKPDLVHLHNIHGHDCDIEMLFRYFKEKKTKLIWTFHDCWAFTAYCPHFTLAGCMKWKKGCHDCPQVQKYSLILDRSEILYRKKRELFSNLDLTIITPSQWLANLVKESFLENYNVKVINNGIDLDVFRPMPSDFRERYQIKREKKIILGVAFGWGFEKGLDVFLRLSEMLDKESYQIILVGTNHVVDKKLPPNIISIHRTNNQKELAEIYTSADVFVNPTREDNYPTVNMEAIACGTPVITFQTGGSAECIDNTCGDVVACDDIQGLYEKIIKICEKEKTTFTIRNSFDKRSKYKMYVECYKEICFEDGGL